MNPERELADTLDDLETLLKSTELGEVLTSKGINTSLALVAVSAIKSYLAGQKAAAAEDFGTVAEEIAARMKHDPVVIAPSPHAKAKPS